MTSLQEYIIHWKPQDGASHRLSPKGNTTHEAPPVYDKNIK